MSVHLGTIGSELWISGNKVQYRRAWISEAMGICVL